MSECRRGEDDTLIETRGIRQFSAKSQGWPAEQKMIDNLDEVLLALPIPIADAVRNELATDRHGPLIEIVLDLGRRPEARFQNSESYLSDRDVTRDDIEHVVDRIGVFGDDNRAGIERTLHRISAIRNRTGAIVGLTCRVGRAVYGTISIIRDLVESGESVLLLGRPGVGKTTMLREVARVLADDLGKRVVIVDTSNEIAGDGDIPHPAIGRARRMQVPTPTAQHAVMIEAVENHMPEVIVIDEIGTELEAMAARTIAERGVQLIGTAHGNTLENLMMNPVLSDLIGGIQSVTLSDEEARRRGTQKSILERKAPPTFNVMVEIISRDEVSVHRDVAQTVDTILRGIAARPELRKRSDSGEVEITKAAQPALPGVSNEPRRMADRDMPRQISREIQPPQGRPSPIQEVIPQPVVAPVSQLPRGRGTQAKPIRIFPFGVSRNRLEQAITQTRIHATIVRDLREADIVLTLKNYFRQKPQPLRDAETRGISVYVLRANTIVQMENVLSSLLPAPPRSDIEPATASTYRQESSNVVGALEEAEHAIGMVMEGGPPISLTPQESYIRKLQHQLADRYNLGSRSKGREPHRHVEIYRAGVK
jgi:stage III sporulation protein SpoIIIAA